MTVANQEQAEYWNSEEASHWVGQQTRYEQMLEPIVAPVLEAAGLRAGDAVLDIGCGCGATTIAAARTVGAGGSALGVDLAAAMLERARAAAAAAGLANVRFEQADAQVHAFGDGVFDALISRFGVMFFADPVAAFANLRRATRADGGRLAFAAWQVMAENEWFLIPLRAFAPFLLEPPAPPAPDAPGPFSFGDPDRLRSILGDAGWRDVSLDPRPLSFLYGGRGTVDDTVEFVRTGRAGKTMLGPLDPDTQRRALDALRTALEPYATDEGVRLSGNIWIVTARA